MISNLILLLFILITNSGTGWCLLDGNATIGDNFKYQVYLKNSVFVCCSGSIIDKYHILTAAHCVFRNTPDQLIVLASRSLAPGFLNAHEVGQIYVHKHYDVDYYSVSDMTSNPWPHHRANDIAILTLKNPLQLDENVMKIQLPTKKTMPCSSAECSIIGWGISHEAGRNDYVQLLWTNAEVMPKLYCDIFEVPIGTNELCVTDLDDTVRVHQTDTGGALVCDGTLVGIIKSYNRPVAVVDVYSFLSFINEIIEMNPFCF